MPSNGGYFVPNQKESWWFLPSISNTSAPTVAELAAGDDITDDIRTISGFTSRANFVTLPRMAQGANPTVTGKEALENSSIQFWEKSSYAANVVKALLAKGVSGYVVRSRYSKAPAAAARVDVFTVDIGGNNRVNTAEDAGAEFVVDFANTDSPVIDATVAA